MDNLNIQEGDFVLVTGAGGSIGSEISRQLAQDGFNLLVNDISEAALFNIWTELRHSGCRIIPVLGDCKHINSKPVFTSIENILKVYHAAAYKHVEMSYMNAETYFMNNYGALLGALDLASRFNSEFLLISTDKAVNPTNNMGISKRLCEMKLLSVRAKNDLSCKIVRFGNVLHSAGSVIPLFLQQIQNGGPILVTHKSAKRFFMSIEQAVSLVLKGHKVHQDYPIVILDMGEPILIDQLARNLAYQQGLRIVPKRTNESEIEIKYIGLRQGEKLEEELTYGHLEKSGIQEVNVAIENFDVCDKLLSHIDESYEKHCSPSYDSINFGDNSWLK